MCVSDNDTMETAFSLGNAARRKFMSANWPWTFASARRGPLSSLKPLWRTNQHGFNGRGHSDLNGWTHTVRAGDCGNWLGFLYWLSGRCGKTSLGLVHTLNVTENHVPIKRARPRKVTGRTDVCPRRTNKTEPHTHTKIKILHTNARCQISIRSCTHTQGRWLCMMLQRSSKLLTHTFHPIDLYNLLIRQFVSNFVLASEWLLHSQSVWMFGPNLKKFPSTDPQIKSIKSILYYWYLAEMWLWWKSKSRTEKSQSIWF